MTNAQLTPNVVVQNPTVRKTAQWVIGVAALLFPALIIVQSETSLDFSTWLPAAVSVTSFLAGAFGIAVMAPNIPSAKKDSYLAHTVEIEEPDYEAIALELTQDLPVELDADESAADDYDENGEPVQRGSHAE